MRRSTDLQHQRSLWGENHVECCTQLSRLRDSASSASTVVVDDSLDGDAAALTTLDALNELATLQRRAEGVVRKMYDKLATARGKYVPPQDADEELLRVAAAEVALYEQQLQLQARLLRSIALRAEPTDIVGACIVWREQPNLPDEELAALWARREAIA